MRTATFLRPGARLGLLLAAGNLSLSACGGTARLPEPKTATTAPQSKAELGTWGVDLSSRDPATAPGDDFFRYANGTWLDSYQLKPDEKRYGSFIELRYRSERQVRAIITELAAGSQAPGSIEQQVGDYYASYMDLAARNRKGLSPLVPDLARIEAITDLPGLVAAFGRASQEGTAAPIAGGVDIDNKNPDRYIVSVGQSGLGLPDRDYYLEQTERFEAVRKSYVEHIARMLQLSGWDTDRSRAAAGRVFALETTMATQHWPRTEMRDADKTYNLYSLDALNSQFAGYDWQGHFAAMAAGDIRELVVSTPSALPPLIQLVHDTPLSTWKEYLRFHLMVGHAAYLSEEIDNANFDFYGRVLNGQQAQRDLWKRAVNQVGALEGLGEAIAQVYVREHFPPESKQKMEHLVENLRRAFKERIQTIDWMGDATKREAQAKLASFNPKIGYPKQWRDLSAIRIERGDLLANVKAVRGYFHAYDMARLSRPTDKAEWFMTPQTVNAYYNPTFNEIVFPAAILQAPFFDPHADPAVNYGAIGAVIGHEMGHGFDDQGSKFDSRGVQRNWWTEEDRRRFELRTKALVAQYSSYSPLPGANVDGDFTQGENIGDLGGLSIAYHAYRLSLGEEPAPVVGGLTGEQRFFLAWSQVWRSKNRDAYLMQRLKSDPHSPERYRVNGVVRNMSAWYQAFEVQPGQALYLEPEQRISIW